MIAVFELANIICRLKKVTIRLQGFECRQKGQIIQALNKIV